MNLLILALLLSAPERVVVVARPGEKAGLFQQLSALAGQAARRLYQKEDPEVARGNALAAENDPAGALEWYDRARLPDSEALHYDRAGQLLKLGAEQAQKARDEAQKALQAQDPSLKAKAAYQLGLAAEQQGQPEEAMKAYQQALALDPQDPDAKVNLELLLKTQEERKKKQPQPQQHESKDKDQKDKQQPDKAKGDERQKDPQKEAGQKEEQKKEDKQQNGQQQAQRKEEEKQEQQAAEQKPVDRSEAERLLDALRAGEKNLQVWRFAKDKRKEARRGEVEKDW